MSERDSICASEEKPLRRFARYRQPAPPDSIRERLSYDPTTGIFTPLVVMRRWRGGSINKRTGYLSIGGYGAHRLAWWFVHNEWPACDIDHVNGNKLDNRIENLRLVTRQQNLWNGRKRKMGKSGHRGVVKNWNRWHAKLSHNGKTLLIGTFDTMEEAVAAYNAKARELRGEFAILNPAKADSEDETSI